MESVFCCCGSVASVVEKKYKRSRKVVQVVKRLGQAPYPDFIDVSCEHDGRSSRVQIDCANLSLRPKLVALPW